MDTITTAVTTYTPPGTSVVHNAQVSLTDRSPASVVHVVQYDNTLPIVAVALIANGQAYTVPSGAAVNVRMKKPDGTYVYNPALGVSADGKTVYIAITVQMTVFSGKASPVVEVALNGAVAGTGFFVLDIDPNPIPEDAIESTDEYKTIQQLAAQVQAAAKIVSDNEAAIQAVADNVDAIQQAPTAAANAAASATLAESWAVGGTGTRTGEDTNNAKFWSEQAAQAANGYLGYFATQAALKSAHPTANAGAWATVGETKTVWFWDGTQFINSTPGATATSAGIVTLQDAPNAAQTAANGYAASPAAILYDAPTQYTFVKGSATLSVPFSAVTRGIIATVRYGGNVNQEVTIVIPKDSAFETTTHRYYAALYLGTWRYVVVAINQGNLVLEYAGDGSSLNETDASYIKAEAF